MSENLEKMNNLFQISLLSVIGLLFSSGIHTYILGSFIAFSYFTMLYIVIGGFFYKNER